MHYFFHGWRRKAGVVTLAMALTSLCAWVRGVEDKFDRISFGDDPAFVLGLTPDGLQASVRLDNGSGDFLSRWDVWRLASIPYWSMTLPLTVLSAYLILWKPRKRAVS